MGEGEGGRGEEAAEATGSVWEGGGLGVVGEVGEGLGLFLDSKSSILARCSLDRFGALAGFCVPYLLAWDATYHRLHHRHHDSMRSRI